jgi:hypothetical protein
MMFEHDAFSGWPLPWAYMKTRRVKGVVKGVASRLLRKGSSSIRSATEKVRSPG